MRKTFLGVAALAACMMSCKSSKQAVVVDLSGEWNIVAVDGQKVAAAEVPYIGLDMANKSLHGNAGCNRLLGSFELDSIHPGTIRFTQVGATRMMCPDMETETKVLAALNKVAGYGETTEGVVLTDAEGNTLLTLVKREAPVVSVNDLKGEWIISQIEGEEVGKTENVPFIALNTDEKRLHGNAGCNVINGGFEQDADQPSSLRFTQVISTMMACPDMETEGKILQALNKVRSFAKGQADGTMVLMDENGAEVMVLLQNVGEPLSK